MLQLLQMWAIVEALGIIFLPLTITVFHNLPDRGWAFSKAIGLAVLAFCVWLPLMTLQFLPFSQLFILGVFVLLLVLNAFGWWRTRKALRELIRTHFIYISFVELIFLGMVFLLGWLRAAGPDISSFEMYMDEGFLAAIMRSPHFPPNDMWYAGQPINYYYYAHYTVGMLAKLLGQTPSVAFNTGICMFFGLTAVNLFGVTSNIVAWAQHHRRLRRQTGASVHSRPDQVLPSMTWAVPFGIFSILLGEVLGNLAATQTWWQNHGGTMPDYYWFNASRVITNTINEFPAFSFLLSCFHAHVLALAFTIVGIGLAFNLFMGHKGQGLQAFGSGWRLPFTLVVTALVIGSLYAMNGWDYPTYLALVLVCLGLQQWRAHNGRFSWDLVLDLFTAGAALAALSFFLFAPFYLNFVSPAQGLGLVQATDRTPLSNEVLIYGVFAFIFFSFLLACFFRPRSSSRPAVAVSPVGPSEPGTESSFQAGRQNGAVQSQSGSSRVSLASVAVQASQERTVQMTAEVVSETGEGSESEETEQSLEGIRIEDLDVATQPAGYEPRTEQEETDVFSASGLKWLDMRVIGLIATVLAGLVVSVVLKNSLTFVVTGSLAALGAVLTLYHLKERERSFTLLLGAVACALVAFCEVIFLRDVFVDQVPRMNTVFKFYFQAWALLSIVGGAGIYFVLDSLNPARRLSVSARWPYTTSRLLWSAAMLIFLLMGAVYPLTAPAQRYQGFTRDMSLDGLDYMKTSSPGDYEAIRWINANITGDPVIVEAPGGEYSLYGRVSIFTGLPDPINWQGHEWQWRVNWVNKGLNSADFSRRLNDVNQIYTSTSPQVVLSLMARYNAQYLYVGSLEQQSYLSSGVSLQRFAAFMKIVYQHDGVTIYQVP